MTPGDDEIYRKHAADLLRFAAGLVGPSAAEDLLSAAVVRAMTSRRWGDVIDHRPYLFRCVLNEAKMSFRTDRRRLARELAVARPDHEVVDHVRLEVAAAVAQLPMDDRAVLYLTYWLDLPAADVASTLRISVRKVERRLSAARHQLRGELE